MKKTRMAIMTISVIVAVAGAFATPPSLICTDYPQFYKVGLNQFEPAGALGSEYYCLDAATTCTYYQPNPIGQPNYYVPCTSGYYMEY
jgi:hypothetical protein